MCPANFDQLIGEGMTNRINLPLDPPAIVKPAEDLAQLAQQINADHEAGEQARKERLSRFRSAGEKLLKAKKLCKHGQWLKWLKENVKFSKTQAHRYMDFAKFPVTGNLDLTGNLDEQESAWQQISGNAPAEDDPDAPAPLPEYITLDQWNEASKEMREQLLSASGDSQFNPQGTAEGIQWALWSWNPVSGCLHNCPYCYARDFAERIYDPKFAPAFWPGRLTAPENTPFPAEKIANESDSVRKKMGLQSVFVCSMADLFGRWVPQEWIEAVLKQCRAAAQWNFLFLTKFPIRMAEFAFPDNAWVGTTVDCQARVANAERSFRKVKARYKWLSCEPLIEPLKFKDLGAFHWIVIGGASKSNHTPEWHPPLEWFIDIKKAADEVGIPVYPKPNLWPPQKYPNDKPWLNAQVAPASLRYLPTVE